MLREKPEEFSVDGVREGSYSPQHTSTHTIQIPMPERPASPRKNGGHLHGLFVCVKLGKLVG